MKKKFIIALTLAVILSVGSPIENAMIAGAQAQQKKKQTYNRNQQKKGQHRNTRRRHNRRRHRRRVHVRVWRAPRYWHPIGFTVTVLAVTAIVVSVESDSEASEPATEYYYDRGTWMKKDGDVYIVIPAPVGAVISELPEGAEPTQASSETYYYYAGDFYKDHDKGKYIVVAAPFGAEVSALPEGYEERNVGKEGEEDYYYVYNGVWYEAVSAGDDVLFVVTPAP